jgi:hypothetical protein
LQKVSLGASEVTIILAPASVTQVTLALV